ncbi:Na+/solute symporter [Magnetococcus marinus MC-1]|uniref:Na+/solute symporter n=1 Tax=Magnetococcus marinus (strain ATCC BAA-1437 / JCM 17883 / MC-1) TaxID=156889 RepID=A0L6G7_MAGMM|nr:sodium:solute symporter family protein [Magnetococcus marinus]ABK43560.1 Na+/solute symporter [Magnetococcus marinus MC-1]
MELQLLIYLFVGLSFALYIGIAIWSKASSTGEFYVAGGGVHPIANGMATAADWMSAASFISMAGLIAFMGYEGGMYLMGWTGGYVLLALLLAPYLRKFGKFTVPEFIGDRYYSSTARVVAVICLIFISFTYVAGQMRGVGIVFSRFLEMDIFWGMVVGMGIVFSYAVLGGMKGVTYTQVAQYCVLIVAYTVPAVFIAIQFTGNPLPQIALGSEMLDGSGYLLQTLDKVLVDIGISSYTEPFNSKERIDVFAITLALMVGTAGLPHVIVRFFTVPKVRDARKSAGWALIFIALLYTTAPAVGALSMMNLVNTVNGKDGTGTKYTEMPNWFKTWETSGLIAWYDHNGDGKLQYAGGNALAGKPAFSDTARGAHGERVVTNPNPKPVQKGTKNFANEIYVDRDIMVLANPEIAQLPNWVIALVAAGGIAAALSTAAGLLLVISASISHDLLKGTFAPGISEKNELLAGRIAAAVAVLVAGYLGYHPPAFVAQVVAFAFGLAASSLFPVIIMGIFSTRMNREGAIAGMLVGLMFTMGYIIYFKGIFIDPIAIANTKEYWLFGISPEGIGSVGMLLNFATAFTISRITKAPPEAIQHMVEDIRIPKGAGSATHH